MQHIELINAKNERWAIDNTQALRASAVVGLGIEVEAEYLRDNGNARVLSQTLKMEQFQADFHFGRGKNEVAYEVYAEFAAFLAQAPLQIQYSTDAGGMIADINLVGLNKTEIQRGSYLKESFRVDRISPWYRIKHYEDKPNHETKNVRGKVYSYIRDYIYTTRASDRTNSFNINNRSLYLANANERMSPVTVRVKAKGVVKNPYWEVFQNSQLINTDGYLVELSDGWELVVSSKFQDQTAILIDPSGIESSVYQQQDINRGGFVCVPTGESSLVFHCGASDVEIDVYEEVDLF